ncbi:MAG: endopeptidase La [Deltaproteobacteria bacterium]|jgi:ATP-dependent Lon protease|nr:endopeptidase La [Deltaproteobacteria bacterium]
MKNNNARVSDAPAPERDDLRVEYSQTDIELPDFMNLLPMAELNSFPGLSSTIAVEEQVSQLVVDRSVHGDGLMALFPLRSLDVDAHKLSSEDFYPMGVAVKILKVHEHESGKLKVTVQGLSRVTFSQIFSGDIPTVRIIPQWDYGNAHDGSLRPLILEAKRLYAEVLTLVPGLPVDLFKINTLLDEEPVILADLIMASLPLKSRAKAEYLLIAGLKHRYLKLLEHLTIEVSNRQAGRAISQRIEAGLDRRQKELHLREQLKAIKAELGESEELDPQGHRALQERLAALPLPEDARATADREMERLNGTPQQSAEYGVIRHYLEWVADLPWGKSDQESLDLGKARAILDRDHYGLEKVKKRVLEFLAVRKLAARGAKTPILCLTGPPGVGKTSLGRSIAECLGRKFARLSLGGLKDEAEIKGHRRAYVGARPGRVLAGLKRVGVNNPVFLLDELDKMATNSQHDPGGALLEALDPEQNETFMDNFLEIPFDISQVLFILTANVLEQIPAPLRDRLEVIEVSGYAVDEKSEIARKHLWPRELARHGLKPKELTLSAPVLETIITTYTWEAGCRELTRRLSALARSRSIAKAEGKPFSRSVSLDELPALLGPPRRLPEVKENKPQIGVVTGLAWTAGGGDIMFIEAVGMPGRGKLSLTGQLGDVMKESAQAAISYVRSRAREWRLDDGWFKNHDIHVHLPQGAIPKDGPSAGVALAVAIVSLVSSHKVRADVAMTGEISLRGLALPVGGIKEKLLAAKRAGIKTVLIPKRNEPDLEEFPKELLKGVNVIPVSSLDQVLARALVAEPVAVGELPTFWEKFAAELMEEEEARIRKVPDLTLEKL